MTNLEKYIKEMAATIKKEGGADKAYHWTEVIMVLEEALKYVPEEKNIEKGHQELVFIGYTNGAQIYHSAVYEDEASGIFFPDTYGETVIPLYMLKCHEHRMEFFDGFSIKSLKEMQLKLQKT